jgi:oligoribonuclease NrnB/cAMP/cGMP phosphodiesterase (DHH superfamily)
MKLYHISHTDLDGYCCQLITNQYFEDCTYYNSNYGPEILVHANKCIELIKLADKDIESMLLFTDLNLTLDHAKDIVSKVEELKKDGYKVELLLLDHHGTGKDCDAKYEWYYLDTSRSATKITYDYFKEKYTYINSSVDEWLAPLVKATNAVDIWLEDDSSFELGKVIMKMISSSKEINKFILKDENSRYKFHLLKETSRYINKESAHIELDENLYFIKKDFFRKDDTNDTFENLVSEYLENQLSKNRDKFTIEYKGHKGIVTYSLGSISVIANYFLKKNPEFAFFMDINFKGNVSLRGHGIIDVSAMAKELFDGGGHPNASGGKIKGFEESFLYDVVKAQVEKIVQTKSK